MIKLELEFTNGDGGFSTSPRTYKQLDRNDAAAIYSRTIKENDKSEGFEVFKIKVKKKGTVIFKRTLEDDEEQYPSAETHFGKSAWHIMDETKARTTFERLKKEAVEVDEPVKVLTVPVGEFTVTELATKNSVEYLEASLWVKAAVVAGSVKFVKAEQRQAKGKKSNIYSAV
jgi:hypothetical protein